MIRHLIYFVVGIFCLSLTLSAGAQQHTSAQSALGSVRANSWTMLSARVRNPEDKPLEYLLTTQLLNSGPQLQFAKRGWLPPHSATREWIPVRTGAFMPGTPSVGTETLLLDTSASPERQIGKREPGLLPAQHAEVLFGLLADADIDPGLTVAAMFKSQNMKPAVVYMNRDRLPTLPELWSGLNCVVLATNQAKLEMAQITALRSYLLGGGRIWIMAERLDQEFMSHLLLQDWTGQVVDQVELAEFTMVRPRGKEMRRFDPPVKMTRMIAPDMETLQTVNGWPIALRKRVGNGQLFITTLEYSGWLKNKNQYCESLTDLGALLVAPAEPTLLPAVNLKHLAEATNYEKATPAATSARGGAAAMPGASTAKPPEIIAANAFNSYLVNQVGYKIVGRNPVIVVLIGFCGLLLVVGLILNAKRRLEYIFPTGLVLAGLATAALLGLGLSQRQARPLTFASLQTGQIVEGQNTLCVSGLMEAYSPGSAGSPLAASRGGLVWPDMAGNEGRLVRMVWTDRDRFQWDNLPLPSGAMQVSEIRNAVTLTNPPTLRGAFGPEGLVTTLEPGPFTDLHTNPILITPMARMVPQIKGKEWVFNEAGILLPGSYISGSVITTTASYRSAVYRQLFDGKRVTEPMLVGWTQQYDSGIQLASGKRGERKESLLIAIPLTLDPTPAGSKVSIPSAFIPYTLPRNIAGTVSAPVYDPRNGTWIKNLNMSVRLFIRFQLPRQVLPLQVDSQNITMDIIAPGRSVELFTLDTNGKERLLNSTSSPMGRVSVDLSGKQTVAVDADGGILIGLKVGAHPSSAVSTWDMESINLSVKGQKLP